MEGSSRVFISPGGVLSDNAAANHKAGCARLSFAVRGFGGLRRRVVVKRKSCNYRLSTTS